MHELTLKNAKWQKSGAHFREFKSCLWFVVVVRLHHRKHVVRAVPPVLVDHERDQLWRYVVAARVHCDEVLLRWLLVESHVSRVVEGGEDLLWLRHCL